MFEEFKWLRVPRVVSLDVLEGHDPFTALILVE